MYTIDKISFRKNKCWRFQVNDIPYIIGFGTLCITGTRSVIISNNTNCEKVTLLQSDVQPYLDAVEQHMCKNTREALVRYLYDNYVKYYDNIRWLDDNGIEKPITPLNGESQSYYDDVAQKIALIKNKKERERATESQSRHIIKPR